jgi:hypothetical protein
MRAVTKRQTSLDRVGLTVFGTALVLAAMASGSAQASDPIVPHSAGPRVVVVHPSGASAPQATPAPTPAPPSAPASSSSPVSGSTAAPGSTSAPAASSGPSGQDAPPPEPQVGLPGGVASSELASLQSQRSVLWQQLEYAIDAGQWGAVEYWQEKVAAVDDQIKDLGGVVDTDGSVLDGPTSGYSPDAEADLTATLNSSGKPGEPPSSDPESDFIQTDPWAGNISTPEDTTVSGPLFVPPLPWDDIGLPGSTECSKFSIGGDGPSLCPD